MNEWLLHYWYFIFGIAGAALYVAWQVRNDQSDESLGRRVLYILAPVLKPNSEARRQLTPLSLWLVGVGLLLVVVAHMLVAFFS